MLRAWGRDTAGLVGGSFQDDAFGQFLQKEPAS